MPSENQRKAAAKQRNRLVRVLIVVFVIMIAVGAANLAVLSSSDVRQEERSADEGPPASAEEIVEDIAGSMPQGTFFKPGPEFKEQNVLSLDGNVITIGIDCVAIVATTSPDRAEAIQSGLAGITPDRPTAYDGWAAMLERFGIKYEGMVMHGLTEDSYLARAYFTFGNHVLDLDIKPSDAIALAVRAKAPMYLNTTMLEEQGRDIC